MGEILPFRRPPPNGGSPTRPCSACGHSMDADAVRCRRCGSPIRFGNDGHGRQRMPGWMILGVILALAVVLGWLLGR